jgi:hypothetical protein
MSVAFSAAGICLSQLQYTAPVYALCKGVALAGMSGAALGSTSCTGSRKHDSSSNSTCTAASQAAPSIVHVCMLLSAASQVQMLAAVVNTAQLLPAAHQHHHQLHLD